MDSANANRSTFAFLALRLLNILVVTSAAVGIFWFQFGIYLLGNAWKDNSTTLMVAVNVGGLGLGLTAIIGSFLSKLKLAYGALVLEAVMAFTLIGLF